MAGLRYWYEKIWGSVGNGQGLDGRQSMDISVTSDTQSPLIEPLIVRGSDRFLKGMSCAIAATILPAFVRAIS